MNPLIGITTYYIKHGESYIENARGLPDQDMLMSTMDYARSVRSVGGLPLAIPVLADGNYLQEIINELDGFIFSGGRDISPLNYNTSIKKGLTMVNPERDEFEFKLLEAVLSAGKPILGICRGFQLINVYFGGSLYQDLAVKPASQLEHFAKMLPKYSPCHRVKLSRDSKLFPVFQSEEILVNSLHHQAIDQVGKGLVVKGKAEDGVIEVLESPDYPDMTAVQWHPEMMAEKDKSQLNIFKLFIRECRRKLSDPKLKEA